MSQRVLACLLLFSLISGCSGGPSGLTINNPRFGQPVIVESGGSFEVTLSARSPIFSDTYTFRLIPGDIPLTVLSSKRDGANRSFNLQLPEDISEASFELQAVAGQMILSAPRSVFVQNKWPSQWDLIQIADLPLIDGEQGEELFKRMIDELIALNPSALLITGDVVYHADPQIWERAMSYLYKLPFPVIVSAGNHEREDWHTYLRYFPNTMHRVRLGDWNVISLDSGHGIDRLTAHQMQWLENQMKASAPYPIIVQIHHPVFGESAFVKRRNEFIELIKENGVAAVLSGHVHFEMFHDVDGNELAMGDSPPQPWFLTATTAGLDRRKNPAGERANAGYLKLKFADGKLISNEGFKWKAYADMEQEGWSMKRSVRD